MTYRSLLRLCWSMLIAFILAAVLFALR